MKSKEKTNSAYTFVDEDNPKQTNKHKILQNDYIDIDF